MTSIIFGANGQDGFYLTRLLQQQNHKVIGVSRGGDFLKTDITDYEAVSALFKQYQPDRIFHLAANSTTRHDAIFENHDTISTGTITILEAAKNFSPNAKVFISGSGLQFENNDLPIKETDPFKANDAYSIARIQSVYAARYFRTLNLKVYVGYFFNHESPLRTERHLCKKISEAVCRIEKGSNELIEIGDADAIKEYTYANDVMEGLIRFVNQDTIFEANLGSGIGYSIKDWMHACFTLTGKNWENHFIKKEGFKAPYKQLVSDPAIIQSLGWYPATSIEQLAKMMMNK